MGPDVLSDIEIAQAATPQHISDIAASAGVPEEYLECYGSYKAKVDYNLLREQKHEPGKLILVTAINPTAAGEGKTTTTVGLGDALSRLGNKAVIALREPSLGPVFGIKGGAAGGGLHRSGHLLRPRRSGGDTGRLRRQCVPDAVHGYAHRRGRRRAARCVLHGAAVYIHEAHLCLRLVSGRGGVYAAVG